ncbi:MULTISPECIES: WD40 repeat domain-containing protein [unclassified Streptomyces]
MGEIQLWDTADPVHPAAKGHSFSGQASSVESLLFSPDGQTLATGGEDGVIRLWALDAGRTTRRVCAVTAHTLTKSEWRRYVGNLPYHPPCP